MTCAYCYCIDRPLTKEHVLPISRGGKGTRTIGVCWDCNQERRDHMDYGPFLVWTEEHPDKWIKILVQALVMRAHDKNYKYVKSIQKLLKREIYDRALHLENRAADAEVDAKHWKEYAADAEADAKRWEEYAADAEANAKRWKAYAADAEADAVTLNEYGLTWMHDAQRAHAAAAAAIAAAAADAAADAAAAAAADATAADAEAVADIISDMSDMSVW